MADVFVSYIHEEQNVADAVQQFLQKQLGQAVFISASPWQVFAGEDWLLRIRQELEASRVVVSLLSPASVGRAWINFEAGAAWLAGKVLIPVCFGGLQVEGLPKPYSNLQALSLPDPDGPYYLYSSIMHHLQPNALTHPPFLPWGEETQGIRNALGLE
jgi:hypothetical protein